MHTVLISFKDDGPRSYSARQVEPARSLGRIAADPAVDLETVVVQRIDARSRVTHDAVVRWLLSPKTARGASSKDPPAPDGGPSLR